MEFDYPSFGWVRPWTRLVEVDFLGSLPMLTSTLLRLTFLSRFQFQVLLTAFCVNTPTPPVTSSSGSETKGSDRRSSRPESSSSSSSRLPSSYVDINVLGSQEDVVIEVSLEPILEGSPIDPNSAPAIYLPSEIYRENIHIPEDEPLIVPPPKSKTPYR